VKGIRQGAREGAQTTVKSLELPVLKQDGQSEAPRSVGTRLNPDHNIPSGPNDPIHPATNLADFIVQLRSGPAYLRTPIGSIAACMDGLTDHFILVEKNPNALGLLQQDFRGICPDCSSWVEENTLGSVWAYSRPEHGNVVMTSYGEVSRLRDGHCINPDCRSEEILLIWKGSQDIRGWILAHLERLHRNADERNDSVLPRYLTKLARPDILNFVTDTIEALTAKPQRGGDYHLCKGQRRADFVVWVSVTPATIQHARRFLSGDFVTQLLRAPGYDSSKQAFAHWICTADLLTLGLRPEETLSEKDQFVIIPEELR
jgi:hypothetical protein